MEDLINMFKTQGTKRLCLVCDYHGTTKEQDEVTVCPKCNGAFVDYYYINKYVKSEKENIKLELTRTIVSDKNLSVLCVSNTVERAKEIYKTELSNDIRNVQFAGVRSVMLDGIRPDVILYLGSYEKAEDYLTPILEPIKRVYQSVIEIRLNI